MDAKLLLQWWNLVFVLPLVLAAFYLGISVMTGIGFGDAQAEADADVDADADIDAHVEADADADTDVDHDVDADHAEAEHDADHEGSSGAAPGMITGAMVWLGAGTVPVSFAVVVLFTAFGIIGLVVNQLLVHMGLVGPAVALISLPAAAIGSVVIVRAIVIVIGRYFPMKGTDARKKDTLVGLSGEAITPVDAQFGLVVVRDKAGNLFQLPCRVSEDHPAIGNGGRVLLVDYNRDGNYFYVQPDELARGEKQ